MVKRAVGALPTALLTIAEEIEAGLRPALVIGVPVGFVNVVESKQTLFAICSQHVVPATAAALEPHCSTARTAAMFAAYK